MAGKKAVKKPTPKTLGSGMASKAAEKLSGRKKQLDDKMKKLGI